jgi:hypothetical protein
MQVEAASWLSVIVRRTPFRTAVNGTLMAQPVRMTLVHRGVIGSPLRPVLDDHRLVARARRTRGRSGTTPSTSRHLAPRSHRSRGGVPEQGRYGSCLPDTACGAYVAFEGFLPVRIVLLAGSPSSMKASTRRED